MSVYTRARFSIRTRGPGRRANATGRALRLILLHVGGAIPGRLDKARLGMPGKYTFCLGENEEESPWEPLHVERGFAPGDSTVTAIGARGVPAGADARARARR